MKVLCKQDYYNWDKKKLFWTKDKLYSYEERKGAYPNGFFSLESNYTPHIGEKRNAFYYNFSNYFYTPEETVNILRTKLIDEML